MLVLWRDSPGDFHSNQTDSSINAVDAVIFIIGVRYVEYGKCSESQSSDYTKVTIILIMKLSAGCYLFYLSAKSFRSARSPHSALESQHSLPCSATQLSLEGFLVHLTNPKVPLVWLAAYSVGSSATAHPLFFSIVIGFCALIAFTIYAGYAFLFCTSIALKACIAVRRPFEFLISALFGSAALAMLLFRQAPQ